MDLHDRGVIGYVCIDQCRIKGDQEMMLITQKKLELAASNAGYGEFWKGFVEDEDLAKCDICCMWGKFGEDVMGNGTDNYCDAHRSESENAQ